MTDDDDPDCVRLGSHNLKPELLRLPESRGRIDLALALLRATEEEALP